MLLFNNWHLSLADGRPAKAFLAMDIVKARFSNEIQNGFAPRISNDDLCENSHKLMLGARGGLR